MDQEKLKNDVLNKLRTVIDPETGSDVIRMGLIQDLEISETGNISYVFRPSSPLCPIAVPLALDIISAISEVNDIKHQSVTVKDYSQAEMLTSLLQNMLDV